MIKIKHYNIDVPQSINDKEWKSCWYGLSRKRECISKYAWDRFKKAEDEAHKLGILGERELEVDLFMSILNNIKSSKITFVELGAGYADWCMAINGIIRNDLINSKEVVSYAIEAEPDHFKWSEEHFKKWDIEGKVLQCAISDKNGWCDFAVDMDSATNYGQGVMFSDGIIRTVSNILTRKSVTVPSYNLDYLMNHLSINHIDLIDMDVQGNELRVVKGAMESIIDKKIDYWKIGTHGNKYNDGLKELLSPYYELLIDVYPHSIGGLDGLKAKVEDGIQVYQRKGL